MSKTLYWTQIQCKVLSVIEAYDQEEAALEKIFHIPTFIQIGQKCQIFSIKGSIHTSARKQKQKNHWNDSQLLILSEVWLLSAVKLLIEWEKLKVGEEKQVAVITELLLIQGLSGSFIETNSSKEERINVKQKWDKKGIVLLFMCLAISNKKEIAGLIYKVKNKGWRGPHAVVQRLLGSLSRK